MPQGPLDDLLPSPDEVLFMGDDLSAIREATGRGDVLSVLGGPGMAWWGACMALSSLGFILRYLDYLPAKLPISALQFVLGYGGTLVFLFLNARKTTFTTWQSQALRLIWIYAGSAIFLFNLGCELTHAVNMPVMNGFLCLMLGVVTGISGAAGRRRWLSIPAIGWMAAGFASFFLSDVVSRQAVLGGAAMAFMVLPGLFLMLGSKTA